jgi:hypothetical protein
LPLRGDRRGQSAAVGTILAIMVMLTLLTVVTTRWIPVWVEGREAEHSATVESQFSSFKQSIDLLAAFGTAGMGVSNPITLGQPGVPIFAPASSGTINVGDFGSGLFRNSFAISNETGGFSVATYGAIKLTTANQRFVHQIHQYEFGGVSVNQSDGQIIKDGPILTFDNSSGQLALRATIVAVAGDGSSFTGDQTVGLRTTLAFTPADLTINFTTPQRLWLNISSEMAVAWGQFMQETLSEQLSSTAFNVTQPSGGTDVAARVDGVWQVSVRYVVIRAEIDVA